MLPRILEPEVMDTPEEAHDYDAMDHSTVNRVFVADFLVLWNGRGPILDVGTGTAQIPIELCRQSPLAQVVGIDLAEQMLKVGRENVLNASLSDRIELRLCDAKVMPFADGHFGAVMSNSIVHHIPMPAQVFPEMVRVAGSGAVLFVRDLMRPTDGTTLRKLVDQYAGDANEHQRKMFAESLHAALTVDEVQAIVTALGFPSDTVRPTSNRHWTWTAVKR